MSYHPSHASVRLQTNPAYYALTKLANTVGYFSLLWLTWRFLTHHLDWQLATGCLIISGAWLLLTWLKTGHLLQTYFDILSRIEMTLPPIVGTIMSVVATVAHSRPLYHIIAVIEVIGWIAIYCLYKHNQHKFRKQGYGPVPENTWISPPLSALKVGDLILTSGNIAKRLHESVGHAETLLADADGNLLLFSSKMDRGTAFQPIEDLDEDTPKSHYVALHLKQPWNREEQAKAYKIAKEMIEVNQAWSAKKNQQIDKIVDMMPVSTQLKKKVKERFYESGYDWFGTFMGRIAKDHWTCIGACLELYKRMGVKTNHYGTGLLGFGTTIFDPIMPVRFLSDPAFQLIKMDEAK